MGEDDLPSVLKRAGEAARSLQHCWIAPGHLLLAVFYLPGPGGESLRACGVVPEMLRADVTNFLLRERRRASKDLRTRGLLIERTTQIVLAFAEGFSLSQHREARSADVLLALIWNGNGASREAIRALERSGTTGQQVMSELARRVTNIPVGSVPKRRIWLPAFPIAAEDFEQVTGELQRNGSVYRYSPRGDEIWISVAEFGDAEIVSADS